MISCNGIYYVTSGCNTTIYCSKNEKKVGEVDNTLSIWLEPGVDVEAGSGFVHVGIVEYVADADVVVAVVVVVVAADARNWSVYVHYQDIHFRRSNTTIYR